MGAEALIGGAMALGNTILDSYWKERNISENWDMWHANNAYNSPENQVKRLRQAGLNPALAMQQGALSSGVSSSPPQPFTNNGAPSFDAVLEGLRISNESRLSRSQSAKLDQESEAERIRNKFALKRQVIELRNLLYSGNVTERQAKKLEREIDYLDKEIQAYDDVTASTIRMNNAKSRIDDANADYQEIINLYAPKEKEKILRNLDGEYDKILSAIRSNDSQSALNYALKAVEKARKEGLEIDNQKARDTAQAYVDKCEAEELKAYFDAQSAGKKYHLGDALGAATPGSNLTDMGDSHYVYTKNGRYLVPDNEPPRAKRKRERQDLDHVK